MTFTFEPMTEWRDRQFVTVVYWSGRFGYFQYDRWLDLRGFGHMIYKLAFCLRWRITNEPGA